MNKLTTASKVRSALQIIVGGHIVTAGIATVVGNEKWYAKVVMPALRNIGLGPETAHWLAVKAAKYKLVPRMKEENPPCLRTELWGKQFQNPLGLAAGFDKNAEGVDGILLMGFGFVEVGSITPEPQEGNPKPRVFRLAEERAIINRYGFNSEGHEAVYRRLQAGNEGKECQAPDDRNRLNEQFWSPDRPTIRVRLKSDRKGILGINLGKNKNSADAVGDYVKGVQKFAELADYLVINVSSPNTPGLRAMQGREQLQQLIDKVLEERNKLPPNRRPPLLVKIAPDLSEQDKVDIAAVVARRQGGIDGLVVSNTTVSRPASLTSSSREEMGGLSGPPLKEMSTQLIREMYRLTQGRIPIIGVGGITSGQDAYEKICAGASLIQIWTALSYDGPPIVRRIKRELGEILLKEGFEKISEAVGSEHKVK